MVMSELNETGPGQESFGPALDTNELLNARAEQTVADALSTVPDQVLKNHIQTVVTEQFSGSTTVDIDSLARQVRQQLETGLNGLNNAQELATQIEQNGFNESKDPNNFWANRADANSMLGKIIIDAHRIVGETVKEILKLSNK